LAKNSTALGSGAVAAGLPSRTAHKRWIARYLSAIRPLATTIVIATVLVFVVEAIARGSTAETLAFFSQPYRPAWSTVALFVLILTALDAIFGRLHQGVLLLGPVALALAATAHQKANYLGDPLYPADFLYGKQIMELLPLLARERVGTAALIVVICAVLALLIPMAWIGWRRRGRAIRGNARIMRLAITLPLLAVFASVMDYANYSWTRDRLWISPMMWDQKENYAHNGFTLAFALNMPMANVAAPEGYSKGAIDKLAAPDVVAAVPAEQPDIIVVMSESFWDPTRLPGVTLTPDPTPAIRATQSGHVFSPEFGGMTANVEFEALTGFSNAFLPYGSIPYQQYVRKPVPTLASFLKSEGYETRALHPFTGWFWNRSQVYEWFGFETFESEETLPVMEKRGLLVSDKALTEEIITEAEEAKDPLFLFAVSLQSHGPYEPNRYPSNSIKVAGVSDKWARGSIATFAEGMKDADQGFQRLIEWAEKREKPTVIAFFGDHLPPLGPAYVATGFLPDNVAPRNAPTPDMLRYRETPLVVWSNRKGAARDIGTVSPSFLPLLVLRQAGIEHPYYTGVLGDVFDRYRVVDRHVLIGVDGKDFPGWTRDDKADPAIRQLRLLQYDIIFGKQHGRERFFPAGWDGLVSGVDWALPLPSGRNPV